MSLQVILESPRPLSNAGSPANAHAFRRDEDLLDFTCRGDSLAFDELVQRYQKRIYALAAGILADEREAAQAAIDTFLAAYRDRNRRESRIPVKRWFFRHAMRTILARKYSPGSHEPPTA